MENDKKFYWLVEDNCDLSVYVEDLTHCQMIIESNFDSLNQDEKEYTQYTITPTWLTQEEIDEMPED